MVVGRRLVGYADEEKDSVRRRRREKNGEREGLTMRENKI